MKDSKEQGQTTGTPVEVNAIVSEFDDKPWDIKSIKISLGGEDDRNGFITFVVFDDTRFEIHEDGPESETSKWCYEDIDIEAARRLRDFLNYAVR